MFFCKEKCGRIFAMKKFILSLVLVLMVGMDAGVVWAVVLDNVGGASGGGDVLPNPNADPSGCEQDITCDETKYFFDTETCGCVSYDEFCANKAKNGETLKWDSAGQTCYDPTVSQGTIIPATTLDETTCELLFTYDASNLNKLKEIVSGGEKKPVELGGVSKMVSPLDILGCGIKTGRVKMWMIPFFVKYLIQFAISIAGLVAVGAIIIGGYFYLFSGLDNDKERGKKAIMYGLLGFIVVLLAWTIVNAAIGLFTR